jgi:hypothetical protein
LSKALQDKLPIPKLVQFFYPDSEEKLALHPKWSAHSLLTFKTGLVVYLSKLESQNLLNQNRLVQWQPVKKYLLTFFVVQELCQMF